MWLNNKHTSDTAVANYRKRLLHTCPNHIVIDGLFNETTLDKVVNILQQSEHWKTQQHTYSALYVDNIQWQNTHQDERFVQRDVWQRNIGLDSDRESDDSGANSKVAQEFLSFLRGGEFMSFLSRIFDVQLTDINVSEPDINTNYFRLAATDFVEQHADDSPGREVCMLLYLNKGWKSKAGGELSFLGADEVNDSHKPITIEPLYNRCVLFDPSSKGSEHWVEKLHHKYADQYRYNVTSWYWAQ